MPANAYEVVLTILSMLLICLIAMVLLKDIVNGKNLREVVGKAIEGTRDSYPPETLNLVTTLLNLGGALAPKTPTQIDNDGLTLLGTALGYEVKINTDGSLAFTRPPLPAGGNFTSAPPVSVTAQESRQEVTTSVTVVPMPGDRVIGAPPAI